MWTMQSKPIPDRFLLWLIVGQFKMGPAPHVTWWRKRGIPHSYGRAQLYLLFFSFACFLSRYRL
jgi:hypothetical protein